MLSGSLNLCLCSRIRGWRRGWVKFNFQAIFRHRTKTFSWTSPAPLQSRLRKRFSRGSRAGRLILLWITQTCAGISCMSKPRQACPVSVDIIQKAFKIYLSLAFTETSCGDHSWDTRMRVHAVRPSSLGRYLRRVRKTCNLASGYIISHWSQLIFRMHLLIVSLHYSGQGILQRMRTFPYTLWNTNCDISGLLTGS
ncbi:hypothetical protein ARMGADRAFT_126807 [Armillaria gallica]|uniref:Uncharacterized protein n=1 Tax=Armillaria gallica TaxID=47427 RepID=A0A2H3E1C9_ARMGA|nr:hypothetical protein ARMGADRAFT_126807 [Armillaria gallica]